MKKISRPFVLTCSIGILISKIAFVIPPSKKLVVHEQDRPISKPVRKMQAAILLDVSNSMDGLIDQAKAQLWNMVSVMGKASCDGQTPSIEIALYEYGRSENDFSKGYVKQLSAFSNDLDGLSQKLFSLKTHGGDEFCGQAIFTSLQELDWDRDTSNYKVIFIAGNEDFLQGPIQFSQGCALATVKGVIVNTIYCGDRLQGIREHWNLGGECGRGSYSNINQDAKADDIATPYDSVLFSLNEKLNATYISYGYSGQVAHESQARLDGMSYGLAKSAALKRVAVKGSKKLYKNESWDLVDAFSKDSMAIAKIDKKTLPANYQNKSTVELEKIVKIQNAERDSIQEKISRLSIERETFLTIKKGQSKTINDATLETEIEKIIRVQAGRLGFAIKN